MNAKYALLGILNQSPNYGYELKKIYDRSFGRDKPISYQSSLRLTTPHYSNANARS